MRTGNFMENKLANVSNVNPMEGDESKESFITRAANVLSCLSDGVNTLTDIAARCGISASTAHRLLASLTKPGLAIYDSVNHRYFLGTRISQLTNNPVTSHQYLILVANNEMKRLSALVEETVTLSLMMGIQYLPLHSVYSSHRLIVLEEFREIRPVEAVGSTDIILLSQLNDKDLRRVLKIGSLWQRSKAVSATDSSYWTEELKKIRRDGYAVTRGQKVPGGIGISAPVKNYICPVALTVIGPEHRIEPRLQELITETRQSARQISEVLLEIFSNKES